MTTKPDVLNEVQLALAQARANAVAIARRSSATSQRRRPGLQRALAAANADPSAAGKAQAAAIQAALAGLDAADAAMRIVSARNQADLPTVVADAFTISGVVTDTTGAALPGVHVEADGASGDKSPLATACTNASGSFQVAVPAPEKEAVASVTLRVTDANRRVLYDGSSTPYPVVRGGLQIVTLVVDPATAYAC
nr:carboxypeptidase-like regulatory domain-containing protein [Kofleriaceae bacterium]